ncbi:MAG: hypothetical protein IJD22_00645, partial [Clostridia bacterium]|nr:hypothetical protein [Clostridia bacterium]
MNRIKHLTMLILKIVFIILCFVLASAMSALQSIPLNETEHLKSHTGLKECTVQFNESDFAETGASASYEIVGSDIVFHITQSGDRYDDIKATVTLPAITYDSSPMRDYLYDILGDKAEREEEYLTAIEEGPWKSELYFSMECNTEDPGYFARSYTLMDPASIEYSEPAEKSGEGSTVYTESFGAEKGKDITFTLTFGTSERGALPSGTYTFSG